MTDPRTLVTQYQRDGLGQNTQLVSPDTGTANQTFDAAGRVLTRTDSRGVVAQHSYDALGRKTGTVWSQTGQASPPAQPAQTYSWTYDQTDGMYTFGIGRFTSSTFPEGSQSFGYDALGRLVQARQILSPVPNPTNNPSAGGNSQAVVHYTGYGYDAGGRLASLTYPSGNTSGSATRPWPSSRPTRPWAQTPQTPRRWCTSSTPTT